MTPVTQGAPRYGTMPRCARVPGLGRTTLCALALFISAASREASAQTAAAAATTEPGLEAVDPEVLTPTGLGDGPFSAMTALLEVSVFQIDIVTLDVRVSPETTERLAAIAHGGEYSEELADSVTALVIDDRNAWIRQVFHRGVSLGRLVDGIRGDMEKAVEAELLDAGAYEEFASRMPTWFAFLEENGASKGDEIFYRIRGDTLQTVYRAVDGNILMNRFSEGPVRRGSVLRSYFAPGSNFREKLVRSLIDAADSQDLPREDS